MSQIHFHQMGGAVGRVAPRRHRVQRPARRLHLQRHLDVDRPDRGRAVTSPPTASVAAALAPLSTGGAYVNFVGDADADRVRSLYGDELYDRLARLKREYDPSNLFSRNQNIRPAR